MPKIHILSGVLEGKTIDLIEERITVGRALDNLIRLEDGTVSHHHATFLADGADYKLRDLNSTNGTRVNGLRIVESKLHNGDQVRLGSVEMRYESDAKKSSQPLPPSKTGVDLTELGGPGAPPPTFTSASPFGRKRGSGASLWMWVFLGLGLIAFTVLALFVIRNIGVK
jgi:pSer/pThr/pTyr-binding forkhead associated (FHA) protein